MGIALKTILSLSMIMVFCVNRASYHQPGADLIAFSYDRPLQLYALLESIQVYVQGLDRIVIIYRSSNDQFYNAYQEVVDAFPEVDFRYQKNLPNEFKRLTLEALMTSKQGHLLFAVDDNIVTDYIDIGYAVKLLEETQAYGFYFRLGTHLTYCYPAQVPQAVPVHQLVVDDVYTWCFKAGEWDWGYPNTVDMTLYRMDEVMATITNLPFNAPNSFEGYWALQAKQVLERNGLFHQHAKIVNLPLNRVQSECENVHMHAFSPEDLLKLFLEGKKIEIHQLYRIDNYAAHMEYLPTFVTR